ncbi:MAG: fimbrial biogenesis outer membrane usher protein [Candidatus Eremiobacteraeota bacterium]|nr:fimbrial biogenesis outer membrane usher protein [Candidatus Eremiobacteraeota bacterium]
MLLPLALLGAAASGAVEDDAPGAPVADAGGDLAYVELIVNAQERGDALAAIAEDDLYVRASDLTAARIDVTGARTRRYGGFDFVSLRSMAPKLQYDFNVSTLVLNITAEASLLPSERYDMAPHSEIPLHYLQEPSAFLNYSFFKSNTGPLGYAAQAGYNFPQALLSSTMFSDGPDFRRGQTYLVYDDRSQLTTTTLGDTFLNLGSFGGANELAGLTYQRAFQLDPYLLRFPAPSITGTVLVPSRAEVYVNGVLTRVVDVAPGTFSFTDIPTVSGLNNTVIVLRDAFGNSRTLTSSDYSSLNLLHEGLTDFAITGGVLRENPFTAQEQYAGGIFAGRWARGYTNNFTAGGRAEFGPDVASGGITAAIAGQLGALGVAYGASRSAGVSDSALEVDFEYQSPTFGMSASSVQTGARYANSGLRVADDRALLVQNADMSFSLGAGGGITVGASRTLDRDSGPSSVASVSLYDTLNASMSLSATGLHTTSLNGPTRTFLAQLIVRTGARGTTILTSTNSYAGAQYTYSPQGTFGTNYTFSFNTDGSGFQDVRFVGQPGTVELNSQKPAGGSASTTALVSGSVVAAADHVFLGRPIQDGYVVLAGAGSNARVQLNGQDAGSSTAGGYLMIPVVQSNADNRVVIDESGEAINQQIDRPQRHFTTRSFGGGTLQFVSHTTEHVYLGILRRDDAREDGNAVAFAPLTLTARGSEQNAQLDGDGGFSFDNLAPGEYSGLANLKGTPCTFTITLPQSDIFQVELGTVFCHLQQPPAA